MRDNWGYPDLAKRSYDDSIDEMRHAEKLIERIIYFDGTPNLQRLNRIRVGSGVTDQFENELALEKATVDALVAAIALCREVGDDEQLPGRLDDGLLAEPCDRRLGWTYRTRQPGHERGLRHHGRQLGPQGLHQQWPDPGALQRRELQASRWADRRAAVCEQRERVALGLGVGLGVGGLP